MDVVVGSSRAFDIVPHMSPGTTVEALPGGKLKNLVPLAKTITPPTYKLSRRPHIYFLCGVPDLSELIKSPEHHPYHYKEVIYVEEPSDTINRYKIALDYAQREIVRHGALPVFATIPQFSLEIYNKHMHTCKPPKTQHSHHTADYTTMQHNLQEAIDAINGYISSINKKVGASTPFLHDTVRQCRGRKGRRYYVYKWDRYRDGLHAGDYLAKQWASVLENTFRLNRERDEDQEEPVSPKRSWKKCRFN